MRLKTKNSIILIIVDSKSVGGLVSPPTSSPMDRPTVYYNFETAAGFTLMGGAQIIAGGKVFHKIKIFQSRTGMAHSVQRRSIYYRDRSLSRFLLPSPLAAGSLSYPK